MNIAFLHRDLPPQAFAGVAVQVHRLANALCRLDHRVTIFTLSPKPTDALYEVHPLDFPGHGFLKKYCAAWKRLWIPWGCRHLNFSGFDIVHVHGDGGWLRYGPHFVRTFYGTAALEARHAPNARGWLAQRYSYALEKREARVCRQSVAISAHVREFLPNIRWIIPCMTGHAPEPESWQRKTTHPSLIYVGSQGGRKRGEMALSLLRELRGEFPDLELHYVGPESEKKTLRENPDYPGLQFHTRLPETELANLYRRSWIYLCFSSYEGFGVPWAEAMSCGCCVVSTPHAAALEWLRDGENALLRSPKTIPKAMADLLRNHEKREGLAKQGLETAIAFSPEHVAEAYAGIYRQARGNH